MSNDQIQRIILQQFYQDMLNSKRNRVEENPELNDIDAKVINGNLSYLLEMGLITGEKRYSADGVGWVIPIGITKKGIDMLGKSQSEVVEKQQTTEKKIDKIMAMLEKNTDLQKNIASILLRMNERDCNREELYEEMDKLAKEWFSSNFD